MKKKSIDPLEFQQYLLLGSRVAKGHSEFQMLARLGYDECEQYACLKFIEWFFKEGKNASIFKIMEKAIEFLGMAHFMPLTKELTKLSMILGDTRKRIKWK